MGRWRQAATASIAELRKVAGQAAMGRQVGMPGDHPYSSGFERTAERTKLESGARHRVVLEVWTASHGGGECRAEADAYGDDLGARWDEVEVVSW